MCNIVVHKLLTKYLRRSNKLNKVCNLVFFHLDTKLLDLMHMRTLKDKQWKNYADLSRLSCFLSSLVLYRHLPLYLLLYCILQIIDNCLSCIFFSSYFSCYFFHFTLPSLMFSGNFEIISFCQSCLIIIFIVSSWFKKFPTVIQ